MLLRVGSCTRWMDTVVACLSVPAELGVYHTWSEHKRVTKVGEGGRSLCLEQSSFVPAVRGGDTFCTVRV